MIGLDRSAKTSVKGPDSRLSLSLSGIALVGVDFGDWNLLAPAEKAILVASIIPSDNEFQTIF